MRFGGFIPFFKKIGFWGILGLPSYDIGATIRIGREILCLLYADFFSDKVNSLTKNGGKKNEKKLLKTIVGDTKKMPKHCEEKLIL